MKLCGFGGRLRHLVKSPLGAATQPPFPRSSLVDGGGVFVCPMVNVGGFLRCLRLTLYVCGHSEILVLDVVE